MPNHLANETSPYLLQHADNPVDWYPWGEAAFAAAREQNKPIFLSIGYAACHWCHVMAHESFENEAIARVLNEHFINIKVDREERPDLDQIYMSSVMLLTQHGGWPMSVFLTPDGKPFFGGTYWPPEQRMGMPGFQDVLRAVIDAWQNKHGDVLRQADQLAGHVAQLATQHGEAGQLSLEPLLHAEAALQRVFDHQHGGFGGAPKFPHSMDLQVLLRVHLRRGHDETLRMVRATLDKMAAGGIYDQLAGGFHRYSVDARWLVPHFEKMLYDNALLAVCYLEAWQVTGDEEYRRVLRETLDFTLRDMTSPEGGFYSTLDADSQGEEGKFYVWTPEEVEAVLGADRAHVFNYVYDVTAQGNFEHAGQNILNMPKTIAQCAAVLKLDPVQLRIDLATSRAQLLEVRRQRVWPGLDDKILVSWNGLMIDAMARAAAALGEPRYLEAAERAADFIWRHMRRDDGRLLHSYRDGRARFDGYLDDYAALANALVSLYEAGFQERRIDQACALSDAMLAHFADNQAGGFYYTAADHEQLIARNKDAQDSSVPSGNSLAAMALLRLGRLCGRSDYLAAAEGTLAAFMHLMEQHPSAAGQMLLALDFQQGPTQELVLVASSADKQLAGITAEVQQRFLPRKVLARRPGEGTSAHLAPLFAGKQATTEPALYICENFACQKPVVGEQAIVQELQRLMLSGR